MLLDVVFSPLIYVVGLAYPLLFIAFAILLVWMIVKIIENMKKK